MKKNSVRSTRAYTKDGKGGCFLGRQQVVTFTRDPATGALTVGKTAPAAQLGAMRLTMDPETGHFFTVGENIASFKW